MPAQLHLPQLAPQHPCRPAEHHQPSALLLDELALPASRESLECKVMVLAHWEVPERLLVGPHQAHLHLAKHVHALLYVASYRTSKAGLFSLSPPCFAIQTLLVNLEKPQFNSTSGRTAVVL